MEDIEMNDQNSTFFSIDIEPKQSLPELASKRFVDRVSVIRELRDIPWDLMYRTYTETISMAYQSSVKPFMEMVKQIQWPWRRKKRESNKGGYAIYRYRRLHLISVGLFLAGSIFAQTGHYPLSNYYELGFIDREQPIPREGLTYSRMMEHLQVGLPVKDRIRLDIRTNEGQRNLVCQFRFGSNYEALLERLKASKMFGPDTLQNPPMGILYQWFDPVEEIQLSVGYRGGVAANGVANYRYTIEPMDAVTRSRFYLSKEGDWQRLPIIGATVLTHPIATFYDKVRTLREDVLPADSLAAYLVSPAVSEAIYLQLNIPRRTLPAKGQVYYTPCRSEAFPFGFLGKVSAVKREGDKHLILFEEVRELELFDVSSESLRPANR